MAMPPPSRSSRLSALLLLGVICLAALVLRFWGIRWGLPNAERAFGFHPDESDVVGASLRTHPLFLLLDPGFYNYGALPLLINGFFLHLAQALGFVPATGPNVPPSANALLLARSITALFGTLTCPFLFGTGRMLYGTRAGLLAAGLYAVAPLAVQHGHFATVDVPATFFVAGCLYFAARCASPERRARDLFWAGVWAGLAGAAKYNAVLVVLAGLVAWWQARRGTKPLIQLMGGTLLGFVVGCPPIYLNPGGLLAAIQFEANHVRTGHGDVFTSTLPGFLYHIITNLFWGMGWPLTVVVLTAVGYAVYRRRAGDTLLAAFALPYYVLIGLAQVKFARYTLPLFPPLLLLVGGLVPPSAHRAFRPVIFGLASAGAFALILAGAFDAAMNGIDPREQAAQFVRQAGAQTVGFATGPWFYSPSLAPGLGNPQPRRAQAAASQAENPRLIPCIRIEQETLADGTTRPHVTPLEWDLPLLTQSQPDMVALSEFEYADSLRINRPETVAYVKALQAAYPQNHVFARPLQVFGIPVEKFIERAGLPCQPLPHDMTYTNPTTLIFTK